MIYQILISVVILIFPIIVYLFYCTYNNNLNKEQSKLFLDISKVPWYLALTLFIWISLMSIIKLKKADYYNDRKNGIWILEIVCLILFILSGLLSTINLYYENDIQVLVLGYFYLIHGILEIIDPLVIHLNGSK